ncbi:uncharacterized protein LOC132745991 [Ruditapes philippinarum]|uniref:uncharacterized protein LOC132745991 n=1 Tax=Ruditapes philippinarum TaxID=129788 RepID=UPI00295B37E0|nr:uncharacterized protein LOC132745991 [Ruditapes philippinarum]
MQAENKESAITCAMPFIKEHIELKLGVSVQTTLNESILISEATILFFECINLHRCGDCIEISNHQCGWCNDAMNCMPHNSLCKSQLIIEKTFCPQLTDSRGRLYVHAGTLTSVLFQGKHLPKVPHLSDSPLQDETTEIYYSSHWARSSNLMDDFKNYGNLISFL